MINIVPGLVEERHKESLKGCCSRRKCRWPTGKWRDAEHPNHQGKENQNHNKLSSHLSEWWLSKRTHKNKCYSEDVERNLLHCCWECRLSVCGKHYGGFSKKLKIEKTLKTLVWKDTCIRNLILYVLLRNKLTQVAAESVIQNRWKDEGVGLSR